MAWCASRGIASAGLFVWRPALCHAFRLVREVRSRRAWTHVLPSLRFAKAEFKRGVGPPIVQLACDACQSVLARLVMLWLGCKLTPPNLRVCLRAKHVFVFAYRVRRLTQICLWQFWLCADSGNACQCLQGKTSVERSSFCNVALGAAKFDSFEKLLKFF